MSQYFNVSTNAGDAAIANAIATNTKLNITHVAFGDGNGAVPTPDKLRTTLVREVHRQAINKYTKHPTVANWITVEAIIPSATGGFWIREIGVIAGGVLITHGSHAPFFKVADTEGVSEYRLKFTIDIQDASVVSLTLNESLIYATQAWVNENYVPRTEIINNLTTADATKPLSAAQGKALQDTKFDADQLGIAGGAAELGVDGFVVDSQLKKASTTQAGILQLVNDLITGGVDKALTAEQGKVLLAGLSFLKNPNGYLKLPDWMGGLILQWGKPGIISSGTLITFPITYPNNVFTIVASDYLGNIATGSAEWGLSGFKSKSAATTIAYTWFSIGC